VNEKPNSPPISILKMIGLILSFQKLTVECGFEDWRIPASHIFMDIHWFLSLICPGKESNDVLRIPNVDQHDGFES
jgi:hypothetical protein